MRLLLLAALLVCAPLAGCDGTYSTGPDNTSTGTGTGTNTNTNTKPGGSGQDCLDDSQCPRGEVCLNQACVTDSGVSSSNSTYYLQKGADCTCGECDPTKGLACVDDNVLKRMVCVSMCDGASDCLSGENCESLGSFSACFPEQESELKPGCTASSCRSGEVCVNFDGIQCRKACTPKPEGTDCTNNASACDDATTCTDVGGGKKQCLQDCAAKDCVQGLTCKDLGGGKKRCVGEEPCPGMTNTGCYEVNTVDNQKATACMTRARLGDTCGNGQGGRPNPTQYCDPDITNIVCALETDWSGVCREKCSTDDNCDTGWTCQAISGSTNKVCAPDPNAKEKPNCNRQ